MDYTPSLLKFLAQNKTRAAGATAGSIFIFSERTGALKCIFEPVLHELTLEATDKDRAPELTTFIILRSKSGAPADPAEHIRTIDKSETGDIITL